MTSRPAQSLTDLLDLVAAAPEGPEVVAFFDFDGTVIDGYSATAVFKERLRRFDVDLFELWDISSAVVEMRLRGTTVDNLMDKAVRALAGKTHEELMEQAYLLFRSEIASQIFPQVRTLIAAHKARGHRIVLSTSATPYQATPVAEDLGFDALICTHPEIGDDGVLTGSLDGLSLWGPRKAAGIQDWAAAEKVDLTGCFGYSNGAEDVPMLETVGIPVALNPDGDLDRTARDRGWARVRLQKPTTGVDVTSTVRSVAALGSVLASAGLGATLGLLSGSRRVGANITNSVAPELALALTGIEVEVIDEANAWSHRPAVFLFNHQSTMDMIVVARVLRRDITAVAKKELARDPRFAPLGALFDVAYVDRANGAQARDAIKPAIEKLQNGTSVAIAPEGTRMPTSRLGRFKKGAFHLAMEAGVPVVPLVLEGAGDVMFRSAFTAHPGKVTVTVGAPVPTDDWTPDTLDEHIAEVREFYERTLGHVR
ncbi:putative phosphoserine phosphatase / 1-acylglycerol-3-phosphate O-acyltransferase [Rhodococcoides kroppenstedtii]|uniref:1-acyl-sn-glycerol-3-phosphate acyltransferase n=1 Tax=Rhodococcoides kroppenstedtii TaxID=293050 RepID=A0A1I0T5T3_9NOCA|nr:HAD-IB family hydrolase [Rhodococcus kroppenstedtii]SFA46396.1 putative phosphoserine phosphatase / 1-acylglycerol-3-phosphate O-acyltransferase [Rhodococcus kroppenstedtii]